MNYDDGDDSYMAITIKVEMNTNKKKHNTAPPQGWRLSLKPICFCDLNVFWPKSKVIDCSIGELSYFPPHLRVSEHYKYN